MKRLRSLHYMRGMSALLVLYAHIAVVGMTDPNSPKRYFPMIGGPAFPPGSEAGAQSIIWPEVFIEGFGLNAGHIGVGVFFLISGFVIMGSLERTDIRAFGLNRIFRILPLSIGVTIGSAALFSAYLHYRGVATPYTVRDTIMSALMLPATLPPIPVIWSLIVEVWFYTILAAAVFVAPNFGFSKIIATAAMCFAGVVAATGLRPIIHGDWLRGR